MLSNWTSIILLSFIATTNYSVLSTCMYSYTQPYCTHGSLLDVLCDSFHLTCPDHGRAMGVMKLPGNSLLHRKQCMTINSLFYVVSLVSSYKISRV